MSKRFFGFLLLCLASHFLIAQEEENDSITIDYQEFVEDNFGLPDEQLDYGQSYESLFQFLFNPIDLNNTTRQELRSINVLSEIQIKSFFKHMNENGPLLTLYEVSKIPEFDEQTVNKLLPYVTVKNPGMEEDEINQSDLNALLQRVLQEENNFFILQYERTFPLSLGYQDIQLPNRRIDRRFVGSADGILGRFRVSNPDDFSIGLTFEKDPGEEITWDPETNRYGMDFYSFHFALENKGFLKRLVIGDYQIQYGQSLLLGAGFSYGKGSATVETARRSSLGAVPYTSSYESGFLRGISSTFQLGPMELTGFYSNRNIDPPEVENDTQDEIFRRLAAQVFGLDQINSSSTGDFEEYLSAIQASGLHRTPREINRKGRINEQVYGGTLAFTSKDQKTHMGVSAMGAEYDPGIDLRFQEFNRFEFSGDRNYNFSYFYDFNLFDFNLYGEAGVSKSGGTGLVTGLIYSPTRKFNLAVVYRDYDKDFHSLYGLAFSENYRTINEKGLYTGLKYAPSQKFQFRAFVDFYKFPGVTFRAFNPSQGYDYLFQFDYKPNWQLNMYLQFRHESEEITVRGDLSVTDEQNLERGIRNWLVFNMDYAGESVLYGKSRFQYTQFDFDDNLSYGYALIQDVGVSLKKFSINTQFSIFDADDLETSQYIFQRDVLYDFTIPFYQAKGFNTNILLQWDPLKNITLWGKVSYTRYKNLEFIDNFEVLDIIEGNEQTDLKFQVMYRF